MPDPSTARDHFAWQRVQAQDRFCKITSDSGKPRGLVWEQIDFENDMQLARDVNDGHLLGLVAITIRFSAVPGGDMEEVEAVGNLRAATAVFLWDGDQWNTAGRVVFNLSPVETIQHFAHELESVQ